MYPAPPPLRPQHVRTLGACSKLLAARLKTDNCWRVVRGACAIMPTVSLVLIYFHLPPGVCLRVRVCVSFQPERGHNWKPQDLSVRAARFFNDICASLVSVFNRLLVRTAKSEWQAGFWFHLSSMKPKLGACMYRIGRLFKIRAHVLCWPHLCLDNIEWRSWVMTPLRATQDDRSFLFQLLYTFTQACLVFIIPADDA